MHKKTVHEQHTKNNNFKLRLKNIKWLRLTNLWEAKN